MTNQSAEQDIVTAAEALAQAIARRVLELVKDGGVRPLTDPQRTYTLKEASETLGISASWIYQNLWRLPHRKLGRRYQFTQEHIDEIQRRHEHNIGPRPQRDPSAPLTRYGPKW